MTLPTFIVIGASRSGTTSLQHYLDQHPDIYMCPVKSPNFFVSGDELPPWESPRLRAMARQWISDRHTYEALFEGVRSETVIGEVSPVYLQSRHAPRRIRETCGEVKLVAILRDPVERAYAHFLGRRRDGLEVRGDFREVVEAELSRPLPDDVAFGSYLGCSRYHPFLEPYFEGFPRDHIRIFLFEELRTDARALLASLCGFLAVDQNVRLDTSGHHNRSGLIQSPVRRIVWTRTVRLRTALRPYLPASVRDAAIPIFGRKVVKPPLHPALRARLIEVFRPDIEKLERLIGRDLSSWLR